MTLLCSAVLLAGCGSSDGDETPVACLAPADAYLRALETAPAPVLLDGETPISSCLVRDQSGGDIATVGEAVIAAATALNAEARRNPAGEATVRLGYLVGALQQGASDTSGIHTDLVRRLDTAARYSAGAGSPGARFERAFGAGYAAGQKSG
jgi:hypothetical protein